MSQSPKHKKYWTCFKYNNNKKYFVKPQKCLNKKVNLQWFMLSFHVTVHQNILKHEACVCTAFYLWLWKRAFLGVLMHFSRFYGNSSKRNLSYIPHTLVKMSGWYKTIPLKIFKKCLLPHSEWLPKPFIVKSKKNNNYILQFTGSFGAWPSLQLVKAFKFSPNCLPCTCTCLSSCL